MSPNEKHPSQDALTPIVSNELLQDAAIKLGAQGWRVFPLQPHGDSAKKPYPGFKFKEQATSNPTEIGALWETHPGAMIGLLLPPGLVVIDIDPRHGGSNEALEDANGGPLPETVTAQSGRGDGAHYYYTTTRGDLVQRELLPGIDSRIGGKGYMVAPPSLHPATGHPYKWLNASDYAPLPKPLEALLAPPPKRQRALYIIETPTQGERAITGIITTIENAPEGNRNAALFWGACRMVERHHAGKPTDFDALASAAEATGLTPGEVRASIQSAYRQYENGGAR